MRSSNVSFVVRERRADACTRRSLAFRTPLFRIDTRCSHRDRDRWCRCQPDRTLGRRHEARSRIAQASHHPSHRRLRRRHPLTSRRSARIRIPAQRRARRGQRETGIRRAWYSERSFAMPDVRAARSATSSSEDGLAAMTAARERTRALGPDVRIHRSHRGVGGRRRITTVARDERGRGRTAASTRRARQGKSGDGDRDENEGSFSKSQLFPIHSPRRGDGSEFAVQRLRFALAEGASHPPEGVRAQAPAFFLRHTGYPSPPGA
ncbi:MAG: hypothetical protein JWO86_5038 [Myxococcaceae bacterium]|nr:hypothetical protein [Myxococcaceae bacterium]